jgi:hypothetical protein
LRDRCQDRPIPAVEDRCDEWRARGVRDPRRFSDERLVASVEAVELADDGDRPFADHEVHQPIIAARGGGSSVVISRVPGRRRADDSLRVIAP